MTGSPENDTIQAGSGTDNINGGGGNDTIMGGSGNDTLIGGPGDNKIEAGSGTTLIQDSGGDNTLIGGTGKDTVSYANRTAQQGVIVTLNGTAGSTGNGQPGENDTITGIENIIGSPGDDVLTGDSSANVIQAGSGNAVINGGNGNDTLLGGSGKDAFTSGTGVNTITTGNSDNIVNAFASAKGSVVNCGSGFNNVTVNPSVTANNCQLVTDPDLKAYNPFSGPPTEVNASLVPPVVTHPGEGFTRFKKLDVLNIPSGGAVSIACQAVSNLCPQGNNPESLNFNAGRSRIHVLPFLKSVKYQLPAKTTLTIVVTGGPNTIGKEFLLTTRSSGSPRTTTACLKPQKPQSGTPTGSGFSTSGGHKTEKCPRPKKAEDSTSVSRRGPRRARAVRLQPESQQQRQRAAAAFAAASAEIRALAQRDAAALSLVP
jgi:hypothetical protein